MGLKIIHNVLAKGGLTIFNLILPLAVMPLECWEYIIMAYVK